MTTEEERKAAAERGHAFKPDAKEPLHCAVCWQYAAWYEHKLALNPPAEGE